jgi:hypothetical protein
VSSALSLAAFQAGSVQLSLGLALTALPKLSHGAALALAPPTVLSFRAPRGADWVPHEPHGGATRPTCLSPTLQVRVYRLSGASKEEVGSTEHHILESDPVFSARVDVPHDPDERQVRRSSTH